MPHVILVDACRSGSPPGEVFELPGEELETVPPLEGINLHAFRWDHAIAFARWLLKNEYPDSIRVFLIEGEQFELGQPLSPAVEAAVERLADRLFELIGGRSDLVFELSEDGYLRLSADAARRFFPEDTMLVLWRDDSLVLVPTRGPAGGGLVLKQRNARGDRSVLVAEAFGFSVPAGRYAARWDPQIGGLRTNVKRHAAGRGDGN